MQKTTNQQTSEPDSKARRESAYDGKPNSLAHRLLPGAADPLIRLLRLDRPIGTWLLAWPALWGLAFAYRAEFGELGKTIGQWSPPIMFLLFFLGAFFTRSAGCVFNDLVDREIDAKVARTKERPLASGAISPVTATLILVALLAISFIILLQLNNLTIGLGVFIILPILIYPFMKRWTNWPQAGLALCFSWGALMGWTAVTNSVDWTGVLILIAAFAWTMGFDTIYAHQDKEDDAVIGMKSTALMFGDKTRTWLVIFYSLALVCLFAAGWLVGARLLYFTAFAIAALHASWQITTLDINDPQNCLRRFRANGLFGMIIFIGIMADLLLAHVLSGGP